MKFDVIVIGGGRSGMAMAERLQKKGLKCAVISKGRSLYGYNPDEFKALGGTVFMGDGVTGGTIENGLVKAVYTENFGSMPIEAKYFYLATGKFFAGGLRADMDKVYEVIFGLDVDCLEDRSEWFNPEFAADQPFMKFGVKVDAQGHAIKDGQSIENLFPIGEIISSMK